MGVSFDPFTTFSVATRAQELLIFLQNLKLIASLLRPEECLQQMLYRRKDGHASVDSEFNAYQEYTYFMGSLMCHSANVLPKQAYASSYGDEVGKENSFQFSPIQKYNAHII